MLDNKLKQRETPMPKHTPGPWEAVVYNGRIQGIITAAQGERHVATIAACSTGVKNCQLIAAAPDLLAACEAFVEGLDDEYSPIFGTEPLDDKETQVYEQAKAAIAKAKGVDEDTDDSGDGSMWENERSPIDYDDLP